MSVYFTRCKQCGEEHRIERTSVVTQTTQPAKYCPQCGADSVVSRMDWDRNYWWDMADSFGFEYSEKGATLVKELYELWEPLDEPYFRRFVEKTIREFQEVS